jgi:hypothetical protein
VELLSLGILFKLNGSIVLDIFNNDRPAGPAEFFSVSQGNAVQLVMPLE